MGLEYDEVFFFGPKHRPIFRGFNHYKYPLENKHPLAGCTFRAFSGQADSGSKQIVQGVHASSVDKMGSTQNPSHLESETVAGLAAKSLAPCSLERRWRWNVLWVTILPGPCDKELNRSPTNGRSKSCFKHVHALSQVAVICHLHSVFMLIWLLVSGSVYITNPNNALYKGNPGNPSKLPYICIVSSPQKR